VDSPLAIELTTTILVVVGALAVVLFVVILVAPWKQVRQEPPLDPEVEAKILLRRDPDDSTEELPSAAVSDLVDTTADDDGVDVAAEHGYDDLRDL
jgi:hypothetical protein